MEREVASNRAAKSGIALEAQQKMYRKYDEELASLLLQWISTTTDSKLDVSGDVDNFIDTLKGGSVLCSLANALEPGAVKKINKGTMVFKQMENISFFLNFAEKYVSKAELFQTIDLYEKADPNAVVICLSALARKSEKLFGRKGLGPKEAEGGKREWSEEQLRAGYGIIGWQMGSNKGANPSGINMGNTRHI